MTSTTTTKNYNTTARPQTPLYYDLSMEDYQQHLDRCGEDDTLAKRIIQGARDLESKGYCVIPGVVETDLCDYAHNRLWEILEGSTSERANPSHRLHQPHSAQDLQGFVRSGVWPMNKHGIFEDAAYAHMDFVHAIRTHPAVATVFAHLYGAKTGLIVAPDRINYQMPAEWLSRTKFDKDWIANPDDIGNAKEASWVHVDQHFNKKGLHCIQGLVVMVDADQPGDASLEVVSGSHLKHGDMVDTLNITELPPRSEDWYPFSDEEKSQLESAGFFDDFTVVRAKKGDLILWDSRLAHQGGRIRAHAVKLPRPNKTPRFVVYVCMQPAWNQLNEKQMKQKHKIFTEMRATSHWPLRSKLFGKPQQYNKTPAEFKFEGYLVKPLDSNNHCIYPVLGEFTGLIQQRGLQSLRFATFHLPLLTFDESSGMRNPNVIIKEKKRKLFSPTTYHAFLTAKEMGVDDEEEEDEEDEKRLKKRARRSDINDDADLDKMMIKDD
jgi:hypothetical protein